MVIKKIAESKKQSDIHNQIVQKVLQIEADLQNHRNYDENIRFMESIVREMDAKILVGVASGEKTEGLEKLKAECEAWINRIYIEKNSESALSSEL
jgi:hypothetical protein